MDARQRKRTGLPAGQEARSCLHTKRKGNRSGLLFAARGGGSGGSGGSRFTTRRAHRGRAGGCTGWSTCSGSTAGRTRGAAGRTRGTAGRHRRAAGRTRGAAGRHRCTARARSTAALLPAATGFDFTSGTQDARAQGGQRKQLATHCRSSLAGSSETGQNSHQSIHWIKASMLQASLRKTAYDHFGNSVQLRRTCDLCC